jgi:hypothetical protein
MNEEKELPEYMQRYLELAQKERDNSEIRRLDAENKLQELSGFSLKPEQNLVEYQLDLKEELDNIYHLLSGHIINVDKEGNERWDEPNDDRLKIFSLYGVKQIMNIISFYINRNTLLSNYDDETIYWKIKDFGIELSDLIFNKYEHFFHYPTPEDLFEKIITILETKYVEEKIVYINPHLNLCFEEKDLYNKCIQWSREELQSKLRHYPMIILAVVDSVHSAYLRALKGEERDSLRKFMHISQTQMPLNQMAMPKQFSLTKPSTWKNA